MRLLLTKKNGDKTIVNVQAFEQLPDEKPRVVRVSTSLPAQTIVDIQRWCRKLGVTMRWFVKEQIQRFCDNGHPLAMFMLYDEERMIPVSYPVEPWMRVALKEEAKEHGETMAGLLREILAGKFE